MEEKEKTIQLNTEDSERLRAETGHTEFTQDTIEYTFVVPKGEVYVDPDLQPGEEAKDEPSEEQPEENENAESDRIDGPEESSSEEEHGPEESGEAQDAEETEDVSDQGAGEDSGRVTRYGLPADHPEMGELARRQEARRRSNEDKKRNFRTKFYVIAASVVVIVGGFLFSISSFFTVDAIVVQGNSHYTAEEIISMGHATPGHNIIYKANKKEITDYLNQNPYIKSAEVKRRLPSTLVIKVTEREERLAFRYDDDYLIMDENGVLLKKTRNKPKTTLVSGIVVNKIKLGEKIGTEDNKRMDKVIDLVKAAGKGDLYFVKFDVSDDKIIKAYVYDTLTVKTGYDTLLENINNGRLHLVIEELFSEGIKRGTISFEEDGSASFMPIM